MKGPPPWSGSGWRFLNAAAKAARSRAGGGMGLILAVAATSTARSQSAEQQEPRWFSMRWTDAYISLDAQGEQETVSSTQGGSATTTRRLYLAPSIGLGALGSVYHPDLFAFSLRAEPGYVWQQTGTPGALNTQNSFLQSYDFSGTVLQLKPYSTGVFANASHDIQEYDFFNSVVADQQTWGLNTGYRAGPVPVTLTYQDSHQDISGLTENTTFDQTSLNLHAHNDRNQNDATDLTFLHGQYSQMIGESGDSFHDSSSYQQVNATDIEHFGKSTLSSSLLYNGLTSQNIPSQSVTPSAELRVDHTEHLHSSYGYIFSHYDDDVSEVDQNYLHAGVQHQLFESLTSALDVHGSESQNSADGSEFNSKNGGVLASLDYTKGLGSWGRLSLGNAASYDLTEQSTMGATLAVPRESHSTSSANPQFRLNQPREILIIAVTADAAHGFQPLVQGLDYFVDQTVDPWQITVNFTSLTVQHLESSGSVTLLVSYDSIPNPSGTYSTVSDQFTARLDLFQGLAGFYSRWQRIQNHAGTPGFVLENLDELEAGADLSWRGLRLDAKYLKRVSSLYDYNSRTLSESYSRKVDGASTVGVNLRQQWSEYPNQNQSATYDDFLAHYDWRDVPLHLTVTAEGGLEHQRGLGLNQDLFTARLHIEWQMGKLNFHLGYDYQNQDFEGEIRARHFAYLRFRRNF